MAPSRYPDGFCYKCRSCGTDQSSRPYLAISIQNTMRLDALIYLIVEVYPEGGAATKTMSRIRSYFGDK